MLSTVVDEHPQTWESHLRAVCVAHNTSIQPTTSYSPFFLMFGRKARLPIDIMYCTGQADNFSVDKFVNDVSVVLENAYQHVCNTMGFKQDHQKELYDHKWHGEIYQTDLVWLHSPVVPRGVSQKLHRPWTGPYKIIKKLADVTYRIQNCNGRRRHRLVVHFDRLKPCRQDMSMEGSSSDKITSPASHTASRDVACEPSVLPTVHDSEDDFIEDSVNNNTERDVLEEHRSHSTDAATAPVEVDSDLHQDPVSAPIGIDSDHQDVSSTNV